MHVYMKRRARQSKCKAQSTKGKVTGWANSAERETKILCRGPEIFYPSALGYEGVY